MTPEPEPEPDPDPPTPTNYTISGTNNGSFNATVWFQTGDTWGSDIVDSKTMNGYGSTASFTVPAGDYFVYYSAAGITNSVVGELKLFGQTVSTTKVTNGSVNGFKSTNKVTVGQNGNMTWTVYLD